MNNEFNNSEQFGQQNQGNNPNVVPSQRRRSFDNRPQKNRAWIPITILLSIIAICFIGFFVIVGSFVSMVGDGFNFSSNNTPVTIKDKTILKLDFGSVSEISTNDNPFSFLRNESPSPSFYELIEGIKAAANDPRIIGLYYDGDAVVGGPMATELKLAILEFKRAGKFMYSYLETASMSQYNIALLSDSIFIPAEGWHEFAGYGISAMFMKGLYDKIGLHYEVVQCEDFKSAAEPLKNYKFSDSARAAYLPYLKQIENNFIESVSTFREIDRDKIISIMENGLLDSDEMLEYSLADDIKTKRQVIAMLEEKVNDNALPANKDEDVSNKKLSNKKTSTKNTSNKISSIINATCENCGGNANSISSFEKENIVCLTDYIHSEVSVYSNKSDNSIAIIVGEGAIVSEAEDDIFSGSEQQIVSSEFVKLIEDAANDDNIKGIVLRINSPGGSVNASEDIYQAVLTAREKKPVYCSMSNLAASGGYYIAMACEKIICHPNTLTGSIGVVAAIPNFSETLKKLNIGVDSITTGTGNPFFLSPGFPVKQKDRERFNKIINKTYQNFVTKAANSRGMTFDEMRAIAKGRIWTGDDAKQRNLVDTLGNLDLAIAMLKDQLGDEDLGLTFYPKPKDSFEEFMKLFSKNKKVSIEDLNLGFTLTEEMKKQINYLAILGRISEKEKVCFALPQLINIK